MPDKKSHKGLDALRGDVKELAEAFWALRDTVLTHQAANAAETPAQIVAPAPAAVVDGDPAISLSGTYVSSTSAGTSVTHAWMLAPTSPDDVLEIDVQRAAAIFAAIGHPARLGVARRLLASPATAADLVTDLHLGTTGAAYHHVNVLLKAGVVTQLQRGLFGIAPEHVPTLIVACAALSPRMVRSESENQPT